MLGSKLRKKCLLLVEFARAKRHFAFDRPRLARLIVFDLPSLAFLQRVVEANKA